MASCAVPADGLRSSRQSGVRRRNTGNGAADHRFAARSTPGDDRQDIPTSRLPQNMRGTSREEKETP